MRGVKMNRPLNSAAAKAHAVRCSRDTGRRFERVADSFLDEIRALQEAFIREVRNKYQPAIHNVVPLEHGITRLATGEFMEKLHEEIDNMLGRMIQAKVQHHPSKGRTLQGS